MYQQTNRQIFENKYEQKKIFKKLTNIYINEIRTRSFAK